MSDAEIRALAVETVFRLHRYALDGAALDWAVNEIVIERRLTHTQEQAFRTALAEGLSIFGGTQQTYAQPALLHL